MVGDLPEIGYLMAALAVNSANSAGFVQSKAESFAVSHPGTPAAVLADFSHWLQAALQKS